MLRPFALPRDRLLSRLPRWTVRVATFLSLSLAPLPAQVPRAANARQIDWQRDLDDALAVARTTGRPLFLAINMDGESASDRIVHEQYDDPAFVALTRRCVCLAASVFRHNARDHDEQGRRIPCPRLGNVTCGEHMALEPVLFAKYLADGDRVAPRHALVRTDGSKTFDLSLCFDLADIDRALAAAVAADPEPRMVPGEADSASALPDPDAALTWAALAARRDHEGRAALERALARTLERPSEAVLLEALAAVGAHGDHGSLEALRLLALRPLALTPAVTAAFGQAVARLDLEEAASALLRAAGQDLGALPGDPGPDPRQRALASLMAGLQPTADDPERRSHERALATIGIGPAGDPAGEEAVDVGALLQDAAAVARGTPALPLLGGPTGAMPPADELERRLEELDREGAANMAPLRERSAASSAVSARRRSPRR